MESSGLLSAAKKGLMSKLERFTGIYGGIFGWRSLKRNRLQKRLEKKGVAKEKRFARLAREFRGRLMLEPLEERIVPAVASVLVDAGEFVLFNFSSMGGDGQTYGIIANAGTDSFVVEMDASQDATPSFLDDGVDLLDSIHLYSDGSGDNLFDEIILTNVRVPLLDDSDVNPADTINATLVTGLQFGFTAQGDQVTFGNMTFNIADDPDGAGGYEYGNFTLIDGVSTDPAFLLDQFGETNAHASDVGAVDANTNGTVHLVERTSIAGQSDSDLDIDGNQPWAGIDTRVAEEDGGDVGVGYGPLDKAGKLTNAGDISVSGIIGARVDGSGNLVETADYVDYLGAQQTKPDTGYGIWAHDGSIFTSSTGLAFQGDPSPGAQISAENIGILKAEWDIGDPVLLGQTIDVGDHLDNYLTADNFNNSTGAAGSDNLTDFIPDGITEQIKGIIAGRNIDLDVIAVDDGIGDIIAGTGGDDGNIVLGQVYANYDNATTPEDMGIDLISAQNGSIQFQIISTDDGTWNDDRLADRNPVAANRIADPYGYDLPQNRPTDIRRIEATAPNPGDFAFIETIGGVGLLHSDADLGPLVSGIVSDPNTNPFGEFWITSQGSAWINLDYVVAEGTGDVIYAPGGFDADITFWRAATMSTGPDDTWGTDDDVLTPYLLNVWAGRDTNGDGLADTGVIWRVEAYDADGNAANDVSASVNFNADYNDLLLNTWYNPLLTIMDLNTAAYGDGTDVTDLFDDNTVVDAQTDLKITTSQIVTEQVPNTIISNDDRIAFAQNTATSDLADSPMLFDLLGIDVDGPYTQSTGPSAGGDHQTDLRNLVIEANLGSPLARTDPSGFNAPFGPAVGIIDLDVSLPLANEPDDIGDVAYLGIVGEIYQFVPIDTVYSEIYVESVMAVGTSAGDNTGTNLANLAMALNDTAGGFWHNVTSVVVSEVEDMDIIAQNTLPGSQFTVNPGFVTYYNIEDGGIFPRAFTPSTGLGDDYNNMLYIGAPPVDASFGIIHANVDYIDGDLSRGIQVHELADPKSVPDYPDNTPYGYNYHIGTISGASPLLSVENAGAAAVALITTNGGSPLGGEIGFIEWEGDVGGVVTVDPDPTDELDAYLGSLSVGLSMENPFTDDDAFTGTVAYNSDLGYVDIEGDIGFVRMSHLTPYDPDFPHAGFGHIPTSVIMGEAIPNAPLVIDVNPSEQVDAALNLQGIFVTQDFLGTLDGGIAVQTNDTVPDSIASHGEELLADFIWDSDIGVRTADLSSVIAGRNIMGDILVDGKIWDNLFAGYFGTGSMGDDPIRIVAENTDPFNPAEGLGDVLPLWWGGPLRDNDTGDIGGDLATYTFSPLTGASGVLMVTTAGGWGWWWSNPAALLYQYRNPGGSEGDDTGTYLNAFERMVNKDWNSETWWWSWWTGNGVSWWFWNPPLPGVETPGFDPLELEDYVGAAERVEADLFAARDINANLIAGEKWISTGGSIDANRDINGHILTGSDLIADVHADADNDGIGNLNGSIIAGLVSQSSLDYTFEFLPDSFGVDLDPSGATAYFYGPGVTDTMYNPLSQSTQVETEENDSPATADPIVGLTYTDPNDPRAVTLSGTIDDVTDVDVYSFEAQIGDTLVVTVIADRVGTFGTGLDPLLTLYAPDGQAIVFSDLTSAGYDGIMEITLPVTGDADVQGKWYIEVSTSAVSPGLSTGDYTLDVMLLPPSNLLTGNILSPDGAGTISGANIYSEIIQAGSRASLTGFSDLVPIGSFMAGFIADFSDDWWGTGHDSWLNFEGSIGSIGQPIEAVAHETTVTLPWWGSPVDWTYSGDIAVHDIRAIGGDIVEVHAGRDIQGWDGVEGWWWFGTYVGGRGPGDWTPQFAEIDAVKYGGLFLNDFTNVLGFEIPPLTQGESVGGDIFEVSAGRDVGTMWWWTWWFGATGWWHYEPLTIHASDNLYLLKAGDDMSDVHVVTDIMPWPSIGTWWGPFGAWWGGALGANLPDDIGGIGLVLAGDDLWGSTFVAGGSFASDTDIPGTYEFDLPNDNPASIAGITIDNTVTIDAGDVDDPTVPAGFAIGQIIAAGANDPVLDVFDYNEPSQTAFWWSWWWALDDDMAYTSVYTKGDVGLIEATVGDIEYLYVDAGSTIWHVSAGDDLINFELYATDHVVLVDAGDDIVNGWINSDNANPFLYGFIPPASAGDGIGGVGVVLAKDAIENLTIDADGVFATDFNIPGDMPAISNPPAEGELFDPVLPAGTGVGVVLARGEGAVLNGGAVDSNIDNLTIWSDGDVLLVWSMSGDIQNSFIQSDSSIFAVQAGPQEVGAGLVTVEMFEDIENTTIMADDHVYFVRAFDDIEGVVITAGADEWWWWGTNGLGAVGIVIAGDSIEETVIQAGGDFGADGDLAAAMPAVVTALLAPTDTYAPMRFEDRKGVIRDLDPFTNAPTFTEDVAVGWVIALGQESEEVDDEDGISDSTILALDGDIALVDAVFGEIENTSITAMGSSIYRVHAGMDIEADTVIQADDHIIEVEAEDDIQASTALHSDLDDDSVGGIGSVIAGGGIEGIDPIDADGTFVPGTFPTAAEAMGMFPSYMIQGDGVTGAADLISTFASSGMVESRDAVITQTDNGITTNVTFTPVARALDGFATDQVVVDVFGTDWANIGYSIVSIIAIGTFDIELDGLDDPEFNDITTASIWADGPIDAIVAETGQLDIDFMIGSDTGDDEVPQSGINFVFSHEGMHDFNIEVEKGHLGVVATDGNMYNMEIDVDRRGDPMPFVGGNLQIVWAGENMYNMDIWVDGAIWGDVSAGQDMGAPGVDVGGVNINADLYVDVVFAGQDMVNVHVEADGVDPAVNGWDPAGRDAALFPEGVESGDIQWVQAGDSIMDSEFWGFHDVKKVTAADWISDTEIVALTGDIDEVSAYVDGVNAIIYAGGLLTSSDFFTLIDGSTTYSINTYDPDGNPSTPPELSAIMAVGVGTVSNLPTFDDHVTWNFGPSPNVFLAGLQGTTDTTYLNFETLMGEGLWEVEGVDVDIPVITFTEDSPFTFDNYEVPVAEDGFGEANLRQLNINAVLGRQDGGGSDHIIRAIGPSRPDDCIIDLDNGALPNNVGDLQLLYVREFGDRWPDDDFKIEVESLSMFGSSDPDIVFNVNRGQLLWEPTVGGQDLQFHIAELTHNESDNTNDTDNVANVSGPVLIFDPMEPAMGKGPSPTVYFFTRADSPFGQYSDAIYLLATDYADAVGSVAYVDGNVTYADAPAAYAIGDVNIFAPGASGFEATASVASITEYGPAIDFIEVEESIGPVAILADPNDPHGNAHLGSISAGFYIGSPVQNSPAIGVDDPIVPASFISIGPWAPDLFPNTPDGWVGEDFTGIINPGPDGLFGTADDFLLACTSADIESIYVEGSIQDTRVSSLFWWLPEIGIGKYNIEVAASGSLTGAAGIQTVDVLQPDGASTGADFESAAFGDDILGDINIDGRITGLIWAGMGKILSLGQDNALSHTFNLWWGWWWHLDLNDDVFELMKDPVMSWWGWWYVGPSLAFDPSIVHPDVDNAPSPFFWWYNLRGMQALGSGQIGTYDDPVTITAAEVVVGDPWFDYFPEDYFWFEMPVSSIQGPDGVYANIDFQEGMVDYAIGSIFGDVGAPEGNTIDIQFMDNASIFANGNLYGPTEIGNMYESIIVVGGDMYGPTTIGEDLSWWGWWTGMDDSTLYVGGDHFGDLTVGEMDDSTVDIGGELDGNGTFGNLWDSDVYIDMGIRGNLVAGGLSEESTLSIGGIDGDSTIGSVYGGSYVSLGGVGGNSSVGSVNDSDVYVGGVGGNSSVGSLSNGAYVSVGSVVGNSSVGNITDSDFSAGSIGGYSSIGSMNNGTASLGSVAGDSTVGNMSNGSQVTISSVGGNSSVSQMSSSTHLITGSLTGNGTIYSMSDSLWQVGNDDPESLYGNVGGNVTVTYGMDDSAVVIGYDLVGAFNIGTYCTVPAYTSMVGSDLWVGHNIGSILVEGDIEASDIVAYTGSIGLIRVGDDIIGPDGDADSDVDIFARGDIAAGADEGIIVQDSIEGRVNIISISGSIGDITVGGDIDKNPNDADGDGIAGWADGAPGRDGVWIIAKYDVGDITVLHGNISGDVIISAGIAVEVTGVENVGQNPYVTSPVGSDEMVLELNNWAFGPGDNDVDPAELTFYIGNLGDITVETGGIFADGDETMLFSATNMMGDITVGNEIGVNGHIVADDRDIQFQAGNGFGTVWVAGDILADGSGEDVNFIGGEAGMAGMYVGNDIHGDDGGEVLIDLLGDLSDTTISATTGCLTYTGALLVGHSIRGEVTVRAASIGDITVGIKGTGNITPDDEEILFEAMGTGGNIGNITVRDVLGGSENFWEDEGEVNIVSQDGAVGDIVAGQIARDAEVNITAETAIGDIVTLDDAEEGWGDLDLEVNSPFGSIGDLIAHGSIEVDDIANIVDIDTFDGSIGDVVSLAGYVELEGLVFGGSIGDIYASEGIYINDVTLEAGNLADDGADGVGLEPDALDGLCRPIYSAAPVDGITSEIDTVEIDDTRVFGNVGNITAFKEVDIDNLDTGGNVGDITSLNGDIFIGPDTDISGDMGSLWAADALEIDDLELLGSLGNVTANGEGVWMYNTSIGGAVGDIIGHADYYPGGFDPNGVYLEYVTILGTVGDITGTSNENAGVRIEDSLIGGMGDVSGTSAEGYGVYIAWTHIDGDVTSISGETEGESGGGLYLYDTVIDGTVGDLFGKAESYTGVYIQDVIILGETGDITGFSIEDYGVYINSSVFGDNVGDITGHSQEEAGVYLDEVNFLGDIGDITGTSQDAAGVYMEYLHIGGDVGDITGETQGDDYGYGVYMFEVVIDGSVSSIYGKSEDYVGVFLEETMLLGGVTGDVEGHSIDDVGVVFTYVNVGGDMDDIIGTSTAAPAIFLEWSTFAGSIDNITALTSDIFLGIEVGGSVGDVVAVTGDIVGVGAYYWWGWWGGSDGQDEYGGSFGYVGLHVHGNIGDVYASQDIWGIDIISETGDIGDGVIYVGNEDTPRASMAGLGGVVSATGDIWAWIHAGHDIYDVRAMKPSFLDPVVNEDGFPEVIYGGNILDGTRITAGHNIGDLDSNTGVYAGGVIEDDVAIIAANTIGVVEAKIIGFGYEDIRECVCIHHELVVEEVPMSFIKIQVPDNDGMLDNNDFLMFNDSNGDDFIDVPWVLAQAISDLDDIYLNPESDYYDPDYVPILADCKISNPEFDLIVDYWGQNWDELKENFEGWITDMDDLEQLTFPDWYNSGNFQFGEVSVEDVDNLIIFTLDGYYEQFDANGDGKPDGIFRDAPDEYGYYNGEYDEGEEVTFNYDVPNLPLVFIDHWWYDEIVEIETVHTHVHTVEPAAMMTIIAQGEDVYSGGELDYRAIGRIEATYDIYANVLVEASRGGIGEVIASHDIGAVGSTESISLNARTAIDLIYAGHNLGRPDVPIEIDVAGSGPGDVITLPMLTGDWDAISANSWIKTNGVGVSGGVIAGSGDINMIVHTGASIGTIQANAGEVSGDFHATGKITGVYGSLGVSGDYVAELGPIDFIFSPTGDVIADVTAGDGITMLGAPFGNIAGTINSGGSIGQIVEGYYADTTDTQVVLSLSNGDEAYVASLNTTYTMDGSGTAVIAINDGEAAITLVGMDGDTVFTSGDSANITVVGDLLGSIEVADDAVIHVTGDFGDHDGYADTITVGQDLALTIDGDLGVDADATFAHLTDFEVDGRILGGVSSVLDTKAGTVDIPDSVCCVSIAGSSTTITAYATVVFDAYVTSVYVMGSGSLVFSSSCDVGTIMAVDDISFVESCDFCEGNYEQLSCQSRINIQCLDVNGNVGNIVDTYANATVQNVTVDGSIGNLYAGFLVNKVEAGGNIGTIASLFGDVKNVTCFGDIETVVAYRDVNEVAAAGRIDEVFASRNISIIRASEVGVVDADMDVNWVSVSGNIELVAGRSVSNVFAGGDVDAIYARLNAMDIRVDGDLDEVVAIQDAKRIDVGGNLNLVSAGRDAKEIAAASINEVHAGRDAYSIAGQDANGDDINVFAGKSATKISPNLDVEVDGVVAAEDDPVIWA